jgi:hypothetical protein
MKLDDDVRNRFQAADARFPGAQPPVDRIVARGRRRRTRRRVGAGLAGVSLALALVVSLAVLLPINRDGRAVTFAADGGARRTSLTNFGVWATYPSDWTLLLGATDESGGASARPVFQLTNFDPGVVGSHAARSWLCPTRGDALPTDGVLLIVGYSAVPDASDPPWPIRLGSNDGDGVCGPGAYASWQALGNRYTAFAATGRDAAPVDRRGMEQAFASLTFAADPGLLFTGFGGMESPQAVLASGRAFGTPWNLFAYTGEVRGRLEGCIGVNAAGAGGSGCYINARGSLDAVDPLFGNREFRWSAGGRCGSDRYLLDGMVSDRVASIDLVLDDGRTIAMQFADLPPSWDAPYFAWIGAVEAPPVGEEISFGRTIDEHRSGEFVLRDAAGAQIDRVVFAVHTDC